MDINTAAFGCCFNCTPPLALIQHAEIFLQALPRIVDSGRVRHADIAEMPGLVPNFGDVLFILGVTHNKAVFVGVFGQPFGFRGFFKGVNNFFAGILPLNRNNVDRKAGMMFAASRVGNVFQRQRFGFLVGITLFLIMVDVPVIVGLLQRNGAVRSAQEQVLPVLLSVLEHFEERLYNTGIHLHIIQGRDIGIITGNGGQINAEILWQRVGQVSEDKLPVVVRFGNSALGV